MAGILKKSLYQNKRTIMDHKNARLHQKYALIVAFAPGNPLFKGRVGWASVWHRLCSAKSSRLNFW
jgi:hypothetical protein